MDKNFTLDKILKLSYGELTESEALKIESELMASDELRKDMNQIEEIKALLDQEICAPNPTSVQIILEESHKQRNEMEAY